LRNCLRALLEHDAADRHGRIDCPLLVLWGKRNVIWNRFDMLGVWRRFASQVAGRGVASGHYIAEEATAEVLSSLTAF
jgi:haloacetate dehalogenase